MSNNNSSSSTDLFFKLSNQPFESFDFSKLNLKDLDKAFTQALEIGRTNYNAIADSDTEATFKNTIFAMTTADEDADLIGNILFNLFSSHTNNEVNALVEKYSPILANYSNEILLNAKLFKRIKHVYENEKNLSPEEQELLNKTFKDFKTNGALLSDSEKEALTKIDTRLSELGPMYSQNLLQSTNSFEYLTTDKSELKGLPESALDAAQADAKTRDKEGYLFTLQYPSMLPVVKYCENRALREKIWRAFAGRATNGEKSNKKILLEVAKLRQEKAKLLGFKTYAELILQERMAKTPENVWKFLEDLEKHSLDPAKKEVLEVEEYAKSKDGLDKLMPWDFSFYSEKIRKEKFDLDEELTRPYFSLDNVIEGAFKHAELLYDVKFSANNDIPKYHEDVMTYEVSDTSGKHIGVFYADFFPRDTKRQGAWCTRFRSQGFFKGEVRRPHVSIVCNFTKPTQNKPSLLTFNEVRTLFHEFGHALHDLLSQCTFRSLSGTSVLWDFVELPSQIMENWTLEKESLNLFAKHYETGEVIPAEMIEKIKSAESFQSGYNCVRQLRFANLDMNWHSKDISNVEDVDKFEKEATQKFSLLPEVEGTNTSCAFAHIFAGGYAAGYYSYKWAEVLDADAFEFFKEKGIFNKDVAKSFKTNILERGGTEHPEHLYKKFRGRTADVKALLKRDGLI